MEGDKRCNQPGCNAEASDFCIFCNKNFCQDHMFKHDCNQSAQYSSDKEKLNSDDNNKETSSNDDNNKCAYPDCSEDACDICSFCNKYYCQDHFFTHICVPTDQLANKPKNKNADSNNNDINNEYVDTKCDFLCCTEEAPFLCHLCNQHYCEKHALDHECSQIKLPASNEATKKVESTISNNNTVNNNSSANNSKSNESNPEINIIKCDFLGCTGEAPFFCSICSQHYCANHCFDHECKH